MAALNQMPRLFEFSRAIKVPTWFTEYGYVIGFLICFTLASSRKWLFDQNGPASGLLLFLLLTMAIAGGYVFKGKSGWCSSMCPLLPVQRMYNQTPFLTVGNSHCAPSVGCTKNYYDFNPKVANLADLYDDDPYYSNYRTFFMGTFPGFILGFVLIPNPPDISILAMYGLFAVNMLVSAGSFYVLDGFVKVSSPKMTTLYGAAAINLFYWFVLPGWLGNIWGFWDGAAPWWLLWSLRVGLVALTGIWIARSFEKEPVFIGQLLPSAQSRVSNNVTSALRQASDKGNVEMTFQPGARRLLMEEGHSLLETAERNDVAIESGRRMGVCGADPIVILNGLDNLSEMEDDERSTLERLGLGGNCRMACMARIQGPVETTLDLNQAEKATTGAVDFTYDPSVNNVVIIGNGIAGVTAADCVRRYHLVFPLDARR